MRILVLLLVVTTWLHADNVALIIGISRYANLKELHTPVNDGQFLAKILRENYGYEVRTLFDSQATRANIVQALKNLCKETKARPADSVLIYYAGHGAEDMELEEGYWLPYETQSELDHISHERLKIYLRAIRTRQMLLVADSCFSGKLIERYIPIGEYDTETRPTKTETEAAVPVTKTESDLPVKMILASGGSEPVLDKTPGGRGHSVFAVKFLDILRSNRGLLALKDETSPMYQQIKEYVSLNATQTPQLGFIYGIGSDKRAFVFRYTAARQHYPAEEFTGEWQSNYGPLLLHLEQGKGQGTYEGGRITWWEVNGDTIRYHYLEGSDAGAGEFSILDSNTLRGGQPERGDWQLWRRNDDAIRQILSIDEPVTEQMQVLLGQDIPELKVSGNVASQGLLKVEACVRGKEFPATLLHLEPGISQRKFHVSVPLTPGTKERIRLSASYPQGKIHRMLLVNRVVSLEIVPGEIALEPGNSYTFRCQGVDADGRLVSHLPVKWEPAALIDAQGVFQTKTAGEYWVEVKLAASSMKSKARVLVRLPSPLLPEEAMQKLSALCLKEADAHYDGQRYLEAIKFYSEAEQYGLRTSHLYLRRAQSYQTTEKLDQAVADYRSALRLSAEEDKAKIYQALAQVYIRLRDWPKAVASYHEARTCAPQWYELYFGEIAIHMEQENWEAAADVIRAAMQVKEDWQLFYYRAQIYEKTEVWSKAKADYETCLRLNPQRTAEITPCLRRVAIILEELRQEQQEKEKAAVLSQLGKYYGSLGELPQRLTQVKIHLDLMHSQEQKWRWMRWIPEGEKRFQSLRQTTAGWEAKLVAAETSMKSLGTARADDNGLAQLKKLAANSLAYAGHLQQLLTQSRSLHNEMVAVEEKARKVRQVEEQKESLLRALEAWWGVENWWQGLVAQVGYIENIYQKTAEYPRVPRRQKMYEKLQRLYPPMETLQNEYLRLRECTASAATCQKLGLLVEQSRALAKTVSKVRSEMEAWAQEVEAKQNQK